MASPRSQREVPVLWSSSGPSRRDNLDGSDPRARTGQQKRGVAPVHLRFPRAARRSRECVRNCMSDKEIGEIGGVSQKASGM